jgi:diguanylate cyclase (GGDEF)-like protein/PAS domain S-box-containing protein
MGDWRTTQALYPDGNPFSLEVSPIEPVALDGETAFLLCLRPARESCEAIDHLGRLLEAAESNESSVIVTDCMGIIEYVNPAFEVLTGFSREEVVGKTPALFQTERCSSKLRTQCWKTLRNGEEFCCVLVNRRKDGGYYHEKMRIRPFINTRGEITHFVSMGRDISALVNRLERIAYLANFDILTGLPNRVLFKDWLKQEFIHASRHGGGFTLLFVDLDLFKPINDLYGHATGDLVLRQVATLIRQCIREEDTVARLGGDEFALILREVSCRQNAGRIVDTIMISLRRGTVVEGRTLSLSASIGACLFPDDGADEHCLLRRADKAMYRAKNAGGNGYCFFDPDLDGHLRPNSVRLSKDNSDRHPHQSSRPGLQVAEFLACSAFRADVFVRLD